MVWEQVAPAMRGKTIFSDGTHIKVHRSGLNAQGGMQAQAIGKTKGGWNTKVHAIVDRSGVPVALCLAPGQEAEIDHAIENLEGIEASTFVGDKGLDADELRIWLYERGITPCIPPKSNRITQFAFDKRAYRRRHIVENFFAHIKTFRRVATRYDKLAITFFGWVLLAVIVKLGK